MTTPPPTLPAASLPTPVFPWAGWLLGSGRLGRLGYGLSLGATALVAAAIVFTFLVLAFSNNKDPDNLIAAWFYAGLVCTGWVRVTLAIRRLHDLDRTGWHAAWISFLDILGFLSHGGLWSIVALAVNLALLLLPGDPTANRYGPATVPARAEPPTP